MKFSIGLCTHFEESVFLGVDEVIIKAIIQRYQVQNGGNIFLMDNHYRKEKILLEIFEGVIEKDHFHQDIEILYVIDGEVEVKQDSQQTLLKRDDILLINANNHHVVKSGEDALFAKISIFYELISDILNKLNLIFICDSTRDDSSRFEKLRKIIRKLIRNHISNHNNTVNFAYISLCYNLADELSDKFLINTDAEIDTASNRNQERINSIDNYIRSNFRNAISMKDMAEKMYLSNGYLSRFFKSTYGMSFQEYLTKIRLHYALDELLYTDYPVTRIVYDNGFANVALFNKAFKKEYGETPSQMRKRYTQEKEEDVHVISSDAEQRLEKLLWGNAEDDDPSQDEVRIISSVQKHELFHPTWRTLINIGTAAELSRSEVQEHILLLHEALKFEYVRFWTPFSKELLIDINNADHYYNFSRLDAVIDFLLKIEVKPFIELAEKPKRLTTTTRKFLAHKKFERPESIENWQSIMDAFIRHLINRYGRDEVSSWKFELWFDVDNIIENKKIQEYVREFKITYETVHKYTDAEVGGSGLHTFVNRGGKNEEKMHEFYKEIIENDAFPDFSTYYIFAYDSGFENGKYVSTPSTDKDFVLRAIRTLKAVGSPMIDNARIGVTEWNLTVSDRNIINDSCFKAAYIMRNYINTLGEVEYMGYFSGTDRISEFYDTVDFLFGGTGLLTKDGVMKPAAFAIDFLNRLYPEFIAKGENYIITTDGYGAYGMVCHNYKHLGSEYYYTEEDCLDRNKLSMYCEDNDITRFSIKLEDVADGIYQAKIYSISDEYGAVMDIWQELGFENDLTRDDIKYFRRNCEPKLAIKKVIAENNIISFDLSMRANEIVYINLLKKEQN